MIALPQQSTGMINNTVYRLWAAIAAVRCVREDENGTTMLEYAVILTLVSIAAVAVLQLINGDVFAAYQSADDAMLP
jgi:Flp pilus assembly pilin Flp